jgi:hypothetical protein
MATSAPPRDSFSRALEKFRADLSHLTADQKAQVTVANLNDVKDAIKSIQDRYGPEKELRSMRRLSKFLEAMSQIEHVVKVFLNVHEVVAFVWVRALYKERSLREVAVLSVPVLTLSRAQSSWD